MGKDLDSLSTSVADVLLTARWNIRDFSIANCKENLIKEVDKPWLYYKGENEMPPGLVTLSSDTAAELYQVAITIAGDLMQRKGVTGDKKVALYSGVQTLLSNIAAELYQAGRTIVGDLIQRKDSTGERKKQVALDRLTFFMNLIMKPTIDVPHSNGMKLMRDIPDLETNTNVTIVLRNVTLRFWQECIDLYDKRKVRICTVGSRNRQDHYYSLPYQVAPRENPYSSILCSF